MSAPITDTLDHLEAVLADAVIDDKDEPGSDSGQKGERE